MTPKYKTLESGWLADEIALQRRVRAIAEEARNRKPEPLTEWRCWFRLPDGERIAVMVTTRALDPMGEAREKLAEFLNVEDEFSLVPTYPGTEFVRDVEEEV